MSTRPGTRYLSGRTSLAASDVGAAYAAVSFTDSVTGDVFSVIDTGWASGTAIMATETGASAPGEVKVQARNAVSDEWVDFTENIVIPAGVTSEVYHGPIYYREFRIMARDYDGFSGAALDISFCISPG